MKKKASKRNQKIYKMKGCFKKTRKSKMGGSGDVNLAYTGKPIVSIPNPFLAYTGRGHGGGGRYINTNASNPAQPNNGPIPNGNIIFNMPNGKIPFDDNSFDLIINNQVLEHVDNIDFALSEMSRVLKTGGIVLSLFPDRSVWREGHVGIAFCHWFSKGSKVRWLYLFIFRLFGFGYHKKNKNIIQWTIDRSNYLDNQTFYISYSEIKYSYKKYFCNITHYEDEYARIRFSNNYFLKLLPNLILSFIVKKLGGLVFDVKKI